MNGHTAASFSHNRIFAATIYYPHGNFMYNISCLFLTPQHLSGRFLHSGKSQLIDETAFNNKSTNKYLSLIFYLLNIGGKNV